MKPQTFRRRPELIQAIQLSPDTYENDLNRNLVQWQPGDAPGGVEIYNALRHSWIYAKWGDWIRVDNPTNNYPVDQETFTNTYSRDEAIRDKDLTGFQT